VHLELLVGRRVRAKNGRPVGRLGEVCAERRGQECLVTEYHIGTEALLEGLLAGAMSVFGMARRTSGRRARWDQLDVSDPDRLRLTCPLKELEELDPEG
jgi:hypothetical protein